MKGVRCKMPVFEGFCESLEASKKVFRKTFCQFFGDARSQNISIMKVLLKRFE